MAKKPPVGSRKRVNLALQGGGAHGAFTWGVLDRLMRDGRIFIDVGRNAYAQHAVAPYAVRPRGTAPVATPLRWEELEDRGLRADGWTIKTIGKRLDSLDDPWEGFRRAARSLPRQR